ncbi:MAG: acyl-CoA/acyl-ACP dehydrogenase [Pirellulales bacterium]|nr:acyl-CoA/acyl-ACP dehydrogenase [Pirellulales bacterium]
MEFDLSDTQRMMQQAARTFLAGECPTARVRRLMASDNAFDAELWSAMAQQGWLGILVDETHGGLGLGLVELVAVAEEMGRACLPGSFLATTWAAATLRSIAPTPKVSSILARIAPGEMRATVALLEESLNWSGESAALPATRSLGDVRLNGRKLLVLDAEVAELILVPALLEGELALVAVEGRPKGLSIRATPGIDATRKLYELAFDDVTLSTDLLLATGAAAELAIRRGIDAATVAVCAELVGGMQWTLETATAYVQTREQFGRAIGSFQAVQHQLADVLLWLESSRSAAYYAAWALNENDPGAAAAISSAKAYVSDAAREVGNRGVQVHGGIGFTWEHDLQLYYKRAKADEILCGDATFHRARLAELVIDVA